MCSECCVLSCSSAAAHWDGIHSSNGIHCTATPAPVDNSISDDCWCPLLPHALTS